MKPFSIVVAHDAKRGIGIQNTLPWRLKADMAYFKHLTTTAAAGKQNAVIMGRKTWESLPEKFRPLPDRLNLVVSRSKQAGFFSLDQALARANEADIDHIFVIGGSALYHEMIRHPHCTRLYITELQETVNCDAFFPDPGPHFRPISATDWQLENGFHYRFCILEK
ncbi:MAG: dihydrofolate reductase [Candidatus Margulisiibacteriota bacterium]